MLSQCEPDGMALRLDGKVLAKAVEHRLSAVIMSISPGIGRPPGLAVLRVGDDPASAVYVANKEKACARIGVASFGAHPGGRNSGGRRARQHPRLECESGGGWNPVAAAAARRTR